MVSAFVVLAAVAAAAGQSDPTSPKIGIYADTHLWRCAHCAYPGAYSNLSLYIIASDLGGTAGIASWEAQVLYDPALFPAGIGWTPAGDEAVLAPWPLPNFHVTIPTGLPAAPAVLLMTMTTFWLGGQGVVGLGPCDPSSVGNAGPAYALVTEPADWEVFAPARASWPWPGVANGFVLAEINHFECCPDAAAQSSWSAVKSLYR